MPHIGIIFRKNFVYRTWPEYPLKVILVTWLEYGTLFFMRNIMNARVLGSFFLIIIESFSSQVFKDFMDGVLKANGTTLLHV